MLRIKYSLRIKEQRNLSKAFARTFCVFTQHSFCTSYLFIYLSIVSLHLLYFFLLYAKLKAFVVHSTDFTDMCEALSLTGSTDQLSRDNLSNAIINNTHMMFIYLFFILHMLIS